jgi:DNA-directed RNA polymerase beta subunit
MTIGQLLESIYAKAGALEGKYFDGTPFHERNLPLMTRIMTQHGFQQYGQEVMYSGATGRKMMSQIFIGPTFYQVIFYLEWTIHCSTAFIQPF